VPVRLAYHIAAEELTVSVPKHRKAEGFRCRARSGDKPDASDGYRKEDDGYWRDGKKNVPAAQAVISGVTPEMFMVLAQMVVRREATYFSLTRESLQSFVDERASALGCSMASQTIYRM